MTTLIHGFELTPNAYWPYEQAFASDIILVLDDEPLTPVTRHWPAIFGRRMLDNKVTYATEEGIYVTLHDNRAYFGRSVRPYRSGTHLPEPQLPVTP